VTRADAAGLRRAREAALQMLYQCEVGRTGAAEAILTYWPSRDPGGEVDDERRAFANRLVTGTLAETEAIDRLLAAHARNWRVERMAVIDRLLLRLAVYELQHAPDTPARVVINEALELARAYSGEEAVPFVNGVLDAVRRHLGRS
jgi:N utilization substance protein B